MPSPPLALPIKGLSTDALCKNLGNLGQTEWGSTVVRQRDFTRPWHYTTLQCIIWRRSGALKLRSGKLIGQFVSKQQYIVVSVLITEYKDDETDI